MARKRIDRERLARLYRDEGLTMQQCADALGCSLGLIYQTLHKAGIPTRDRGTGRRGKGNARYINRLGYVVVYDPSLAGTTSPVTLEHRLVMQRILRRRLRPGETVHHLNGNRADNRPENLRLYTSQAAHMSDHQRGRAWSRKYLCCIECGTTERRHGARGRCVNCHNRWLRRLKHED